METLWQDAHYGVRMLMKKPGLTLIAALSLALGIGVNTSIFSVVNALFSRQLPVLQPDRLMLVFNGSLNNPWLTFTTLPILLAMVALLASDFSVRRAMKVHPKVALRCV